MADTEFGNKLNAGLRYGATVAATGFTLMAVVSLLTPQQVADLKQQVEILNASIWSGYGALTKMWAILGPIAIGVAVKMGWSSSSVQAMAGKLLRIAVKDPSQASTEAKVAIVNAASSPDIGSKAVINPELAANPATAANVVADVKMVTPIGAAVGKVGVLLLGIAIATLIGMQPTFAQGSARTTRIRVAATTAAVPTTPPRLVMTGHPIADLVANLDLKSSKNPVQALQDLATKIANTNHDDLQYSIAMATAAGTPQSKQRLACLSAINDLNNQLNLNQVKDPATGQPMTRPAEPHVFIDMESFSEVIDALQPTGPLFSGCAGAAQLAKTNVFSFINAAVTSVAALAAVPVVPGL